MQHQTFIKQLTEKKEVVLFEDVKCSTLEFILTQKGVNVYMNHILENVTPYTVNQAWFMYRKAIESYRKPKKKLSDEQRIYFGGSYK